ncbi:KPN_02809 family neutral zinc metallopeptidase [Phytohabitans rumicis]|uniref:Membrane protein n=1 Tax=Phytohabitans rumicis TaxID=1076125 RepID=A0A6V8LD64_9ACTN|nr:neutral zinc metallopeptidase [Phytohabitans rumicis]GFJ92928.1 membrane protein [Phytohabitans rumicis]
MEFNKDADLDTSQVEDMRGTRGGGRPRLPGPGFKLPAGKGGLLVVAVVLVCLLGFLCLGQGGLGGLGSLGSLGGLTGSDTETADNTQLDQACSRENANRFDNPACVNLAFINSIQAYWQRGLPENFGRPYQTATTRYFSGAVSTGCGAADSGVGPFYCPADNHVYIDLSFYDELANRFGAPGQFAQAYVTAHEYGHHVQTLLGTEAQMRRQQQRDPGNANALSVLLELQADCYAGVWANKATQTTDAGGQPLFTGVTEQDIQQALTAAAAVGDDTIQRQSTGRVNEQAFTHGSAQERQQWFDHGYRTGDPKRCDTFGNAL